MPTLYVGVTARNARDGRSNVTTFGQLDPDMIEIVFLELKTAVWEIASPENVEMIQDHPAETGPQTPWHIIVRCSTELLADAVVTVVLSVRQRLVPPVES